MKATHRLLLFMSILTGSTAFGNSGNNQSYFTQDVVLQQHGLCETTTADFDMFHVSAKVAQNKADWLERFLSGRLEDDIVIFESSQNAHDEKEVLSRDLYELDPQGYIIFLGFMGDGRSTYDVYVHDKKIHGASVSNEFLENQKLTFGTSFPCADKNIAASSKTSGFIKVGKGRYEGPVIPDAMRRPGVPAPGNLPSPTSGPHNGGPNAPKPPSPWVSVPSPAEGYRPVVGHNGVITLITEEQYQAYIDHLLGPNPYPIIPPTVPVRPPRPNRPARPQSDGSRPTTSHGTSHDSPHASGCSCSSTTEGTGPRKRVLKK